MVAFFAFNLFRDCIFTVCFQNLLVLFVPYTYLFGCVSVASTFFCVCVWLWFFFAPKEFNYFEIHAHTLTVYEVCLWTWYLWFQFIFRKKKKKMLIARFIKVNTIFQCSIVFPFFCCLFARLICITWLCECEQDNMIKKTKKTTQC